MASPDVVCQPCGSALGAPTKECSTAHKTLFLPRNWQSGRAHEDTECATAAHPPTGSILLQPCNHGRFALRQHDRRGTRRSRKFSSAVVAPHRDVTTVRGRELRYERRAAWRRHDELGYERFPCRFGGAKMWLKKDLPDGRQVQRIFIPKGFDWVKTISPMLSKAGEGPVMWCPVTHFGYLESGSMGIKFKDDPDNIKIIKVAPVWKSDFAGFATCTPSTRHPTHRSICAQAGETYLVPPGHIPIMNEDAVMIEFTQDTTYTNAEVQAKMKD